MKDRDTQRIFPDAKQDIDRWDDVPDTAQTRHPAYRLAFGDPDFLLRDELRPVRLQLELLKPELLMAERGIQSTIVLFGGARIPRPEDAAKASTPALGELSRFYEEARKFAYAMTLRSVQAYGARMDFVTGGGPGVDGSGQSGGRTGGGFPHGLKYCAAHNRRRMYDVTPDPYASTLHYFAIRQMHF